MCLVKEIKLIQKEKFLVVVKLKDFDWYGLEYRSEEGISKLNYVRHFASVLDDEQKWKQSYSRASNGSFLKRGKTGGYVRVVNSLVPDTVIRLFDLRTRDKIERAVDKGEFVIDGTNRVRDL